jgi:SAM-dependent methyltransferase
MKTLKRAALRWLWPLMPGWPDEGRRIVQGPNLRRMLRRATRHSGSFQRVFNAGAGEGGYSRMLLALPGVKSVLESDYGFRTQHPVQIDPKQVFFGASLVEIPIPPRSVDLILCTEVLEHIVEHDLALDELARIIVPGGWLLITVPTPPAVPDPNHAREGYRPEELAGMLETRGFEVVETRFCMYLPFRFVLSTWSRWVWKPRLLIRTLAFLDRWVVVGPPMDLMILARAKAHS